MSNFVYSLRYTIDPRTNTPEKDTKFFKFVQDAQIDDVAFFINPEELNASHLTEKETQIWLDAIIPLQKKIAEMGVTTSLNPWTTINHSDRGLSVNPEIGFDTLVDINGKKANSMGCPADQKWRDYLAERYAQYASIHPKELWLEDDFRHYNHTPLKLACFCDHHMKIYQDKLGRTISRVDFVKEVLKPGKPTKARTVYLETARQEMIDTVAQVEKSVHQVSRETNLALMTSFPDWHAMEGRDWPTLFDTLVGENHPRVARPHLPAYNEISPLKYSRVFEEYTIITAAYLGDGAVLYPELENYMYSGFVKSEKFTKFQIETAALVGASGILLNIFDMIGNGINETYHYAEMLSEIKPFLNKISEQRLQMNKIKGIQILVSQDSGFTIHTTAGANPEELLPHEKNWAALLSTFGFSTTVTPVVQGDKFEGQTLAISGQLLRNFDNESITSIIRDNNVILDGESIQVIIDRGLGAKLLRLRTSEWHPYRTGYQFFEQADGKVVEGVNNPRITMLQHTGNYLQLEYQADADVDVWTRAYNSVDEQLGNVMTIIDKHILLVPMDQDPKYGWESQYVGYKQGLYQQMIDNITSIDYLVDMPNVKLNVSEDKSVIWISNFTIDDYRKIIWKPSFELGSKEATIIRRTDGSYTEEKVQLSEKSGLIEIDETLSGLETIQIRL